MKFWIYFIFMHINNRVVYNTYKYAFSDNDQIDFE